MQCRNCGTEIADKAIVCYRCGVGTSDPVRKPVPIRPSGRGPSLVAGIVPLLLALVALVMADRSGYPEELSTAAMVLAGLGVLLLIARILRRR